MTEPISRLSRQVIDGSVPPHALVDLAYDTIEALEPDIRAWEWLRPRDASHAWLREHSDWLQATPLKGLPVGVKDIIDTADAPTCLGSPLHAARQPGEDAACVARLRQAGALILGKTVTTEFAYFAPGRTRNPNDLQCTPGGSSSGSAAAVASGMVPVALGTQTAGSVIRPASYCGSWGYASTRGMLSLRGVLPFAPALDTLGVFAADTVVLNRISAVLCGPAGPGREEPGAIEVFQVPGEIFGPVSPAMEQAVAGIGARLTATGHIVRPFSDPGGALARLVEIHPRIMAFEAAQGLAFESARSEALSPQLRELLALGQTITLREHAETLTEVAALAAVLPSGPHQMFLCPGAADSAPEGLESTGSPHMSRAWQALGRPAVAIPAGLDAKARPLGAQLVGARGADASLLVLAEALDAAF